VKYVLLIYQPEGYDPGALSEDQYKEVAAAYAAINATPNVRSGLPLGFARDAITVRVRDGQMVSSPGPYVEQPGGTLGGYVEFEAENDEEAVALASKIPAVVQGGAVEIRPSKVYW
jgi:hypothetical protein